MTPLGLLSRSFWPVRTWWSVWWSTLWGGQMAPVPQARTVAEAAAYIDEIRRHYKPDPWDGRVDYTEDPRRIEWFRRRSELAGFPGGLDCDDIAAAADACTTDLAPDGQTWVLIDPGPWSHAVYVFQAEGRLWILDTNGLTEIKAGRTLLQTMGDIYPQARYEDAFPVAYPFADPRRI